MKVVHCKMESYDIYIGRPSVWGNKFSHKQGTKAEFHVETVDEAIVKYEEWIRGNPELLAKLPELIGKVLGCWCAGKGGLSINNIPFKCHGQVLIKLVLEMLKEEAGGSV